MPGGDTGEIWHTVTQPEAAALRQYELAGFSIERKQPANGRNRGELHSIVQA